MDLLKYIGFFLVSIIFNEKVRPGELMLIDRETGKQLAFQITGLKKTNDGKEEAVLHIITGLPSGRKKVYLLQKGIPENSPAIQMQNLGGEIMLRSDKLTVVDSDPSIWLNFDPVPGEGFRRSINLYDGSRDNSGYPVDLYYPK